MNTPNKLTLLRILLIPFFLLFLLVEQIPHHFLWALAIFIIASLTDMLDGYLARKNNLVTDFGKFLDPLADKMLVTSALICFIELKVAPAIVVVLIIFREFMVTSIRLVASGSGEVIAASIWGKLKTVAQLVSICVILLMQELVENVWLAFSTAYFWGLLLLWICVALTLVSGGQYLWAYRKYITQSK